MVIVTEGLYRNRQICIYSLNSTGAPTQSLRPHVPKEADHKNPILNYPKSAGEQGEDQTQDGAGNLASRQDSDHARLVHAGRQ
jgi:hypothetical protein